MSASGLKLKSFKLHTNRYVLHIGTWTWGLANKRNTVKYLYMEEVCLKIDIR